MKTLGVVVVPSVRTVGTVFVVGSKGSFDRIRSIWFWAQICASLYRRDVTLYLLMALKPMKQPAAMEPRTPSAIRISTRVKPARWRDFLTAAIRILPPE